MTSQLLGWLKSRAPRASLFRLASLDQPTRLLLGPLSLAPSARPSWIRPLGSALLSAPLGSAPTDQPTRIGSLHSALLDNPTQIGPLAQPPPPCIRPLGSALSDEPRRIASPPPFHSTISDQSHRIGPLGPALPSARSPLNGSTSSARPPRFGPLGMTSPKRSAPSVRPSKKAPLGSPSSSLALSARPPRNTLHGPLQSARPIQFDPLRPEHLAWYTWLKPLRLGSSSLVHSATAEALVPLYHCPRSLSQSLLQSLLHLLI